MQLILIGLALIGAIIAGATRNKTWQMRSVALTTLHNQEGMHAHFWTRSYQCHTAFKPEQIFTGIETPDILCYSSLYDAVPTGRILMGDGNISR